MRRVPWLRQCFQGWCEHPTCGANAFGGCQCRKGHARCAASSAAGSYPQPCTVTDAGRLNDELPPAVRDPDPHLRAAAVGAWATHCTEVGVLPHAAVACSGWRCRLRVAFNVLLINMETVCI
jgi:hypothetical protein